MPDRFQANALHKWNGTLTTILVKDGFTPPVAARIYAYPHIAAYEVARHANDSFVSLAGKINEFQLPPEPGENQKIHFEFASAVAFNKVARELVYSEFIFDPIEQKVFEKFREKLREDVYEASMSYGEKVASHVLAYSSTDNYNDTRNMTKYEFSDTPGAWVLTPPAYIDAIEPHWDKIRTFVLDSASQFLPVAPPKFDSIEGSRFMADTRQVLDSTNGLDAEKEAIAKFWDCNPNILKHTGHVKYFTKQMSPGAHWIEITTIVNKKLNNDLVRSSHAYALTSISLFDAFISCWHAKYKYNLIRPETVINLYIDKNWKPLLQTPAFPEYTSGHSVISRAAAVTLTHLFGNDVSFIDSTEIHYDLEPRSYNSFIEASDEAAISRLYGGIHYMPAITEGVKQGAKVGKLVNEKLVLIKPNSQSPQITKK